MDGRRSQEEKLNSAQYILPNPAPSMSSSESDDTLVMVSVPESSAEEEEFRTPPERHSHSLTCSNEAALELVEEVDCGGLQEDIEKTVDLSRDSDVKTMDKDGHGFGEVTKRRQKGSEDEAMDEDLVIEEGQANELQCDGEDIIEEVVVSQNARSKVRKLPSSFCTQGQDGATRSDPGSCRVRTDKRCAALETVQGGHRAGTCGGNSSAGAEKGVVKEQEIGDAGKANGKKPSQSNEKEEPTEEELTENILKVLDFLSKRQRPVYEGKVDIIGSAIKGGTDFPRPSWWPEDSDDESN